MLKPAEPISAFNGESSMGTWTLVNWYRISDDGALTSWGIEYCGVDANNLAIEKLIAHLFRSIQILRKTGLQLSEKMQAVDVVMYDLLGRKVLTDTRVLW
jgi:subtilisin-like proprotein convertase family protein